MSLKFALYILRKLVIFMMADQLQQPQNFVKELLPRFDISLGAQSQSTCTYCRKHLPIHHERIYCQCKCRVFCSNICSGADELRRSCCPHNCQSIQEKTEDVMAKLNDFGGMFGFDIHAYLTEEEREGVPSNMYGFGYADENELSIWESDSDDGEDVWWWQWLNG